MALESLPKTCRRGRPRSGPSRPEWTAGKGIQRASSEASHLGITTTLKVDFCGIPRNSLQLQTGTGDLNPFRTRKVQQNRGERKHQCCFPSFLPSLMARVTLAGFLVSSLPQRLAVPPTTLVPFLSLTLSCFHCLCPPPVSAQVL